MLQLSHLNKVWIKKLILPSKLGSNNWCLIFFSLFFCASLLAAPPIKKSATFIEYLQQENAHLTTAINDAKKPILLGNENDYNAKMQEVSSLLAIIDLKIRSLEGFIDQQNKEQLILNQRLKHLQQLPAPKEGISIAERVAKIDNLLNINQKTNQILNDSLKLAQEYQATLNNNTKNIESWHSNYIFEEKLKQLHRLKKQLNQQLAHYFADNIQINKLDKRSKSAPLTKVDYEAKFLLNNQNIAAIQNHLNALNIQKNIIKADIIYLKNPDTKNLQLITDIYKDSLNQYSKVEKSMQQSINFLNNEAKLINTPILKSLIISLQNEVAQQVTETNLQKQFLIKNLDNYQTQLKNLLSLRQSLAEYNISSWPIILNKIAAIPSLFFKYIKTLCLKVYDSYLWLSTLSVILLWSSFALISIYFFLVSKFLKSLRRDKERSRLTGYLYDGVLVLIQRNIPYLCFISMLWILFYVTHISAVNYQLLFKLIAVWFIFKILILICRLVLLESISDASGKDVKLYYRLKWLLLFGGWTTALMNIGHLLPLSLLLQDIFNRLFMLFLLTVSLVAWKSKDVIPYLLNPLLNKQKRYVQNAISLLVILAPITLLTTAVIGLLGYINLAWNMSRYQAYALLVLVGYTLIRGLIFDALEFFSELMISSLRNGWLWIEVFLKPFDKILRIVLLLGSILVLFQLFGWNSESVVMINLGKISQYTILNLPGIHITVSSTIGFFILLALFFWASKWTREFCYRWLFINVKDAGIRHSISVFSQYSVVLLGGFITLHVLGFDFSGLSMIIGGLAVGMGFGLRDFASNVIGGIMLLIERPVREGDLVTIGEHEGKVAHIGIRSMRVSSWDNMEVLIPNAETFNKPFTNWTHQDSIIRTVIPIKVSRADDPLMIQQLIWDVLATTPEIVSDPPAQVLLKKIDAALLEFEARYFINIQLHARVEVQSKVLFAIMAQFKAANVRAPIEPIAVEIKEGQGENLILKKQPSKN